jgi:hypothetical protein
MVHVNNTSIMPTTSVMMPTSAVSFSQSVGPDVFLDTSRKTKGKIDFPERKC